MQSDNVQQDVTIVPLTIPLTVGPGTIGALLVMGVGQGWEAKLISLVAIFLACLTSAPRSIFPTASNACLATRGYRSSVA